MRIQPEGLGDRLFQFQLDLKRVLPRREPRPVADSKDVRVDRECLFIEGGVEDHVGGLAAHSGKLLELLARAGNLAAMVADKRLRQGNDVLRLGVE
jgi:hypothetical protein